MRRARRVAVALAVLGLGAWLLPWLVPMPPGLQDDGHGVVLLDRQERPLREAWTDDRGAGRRVPLSRISPHVVLATLAAEDARFRQHGGVDAVAVARALLDNLRAGRVVAGGSTVTQQVVANLCGRGEGLPGKAVEALRALRLERTLSKDRILELYLNRVPYGNNTRGIESAARYYLGRPASELSLAQAAFLAAIPRGPTEYDPLRHAERTRQRQRWILERMRSLGWIEEDAYQRALAEPVEARPHPAAFRAPHFTDLVLSRLPPGAAMVRTTLDLDLQRDVERVVRTRVADLAERGVNGAAVVVMDVASGEVRALVGSPDFFDEGADGQVDLALSPRQPGSALKPFTYGLALEKGMSAATVLADVPVRYRTRGGVFAPTNYDERWHGPVRLRTALACSYNVPAVRVLHELGVERLLERLRALGMGSLDRLSDHYGLALTLGAGEVTLLELTRAYRALARGGRYAPERLWKEVRNGEGGRVHEVPAEDERRVFSPRVAWLLTDILSDADARAPAFGQDSPLRLPFPCAVKTGTSRDFRDNWTVGYSPRFVVGVWLGHTRGLPMREVSGVTGAAPIFRDVMLRLHPESTGFARPAGLTRAVVCAASGRRPGPHCRSTLSEWFMEVPVPTASCDIHRELAGRVYECWPAVYADWMRANCIPVPPPAAPDGFRITSPRDGDVFVIDPTMDRSHQALRLTASSPTQTTWWMDGRELDGDEWPLAPGEHYLEARTGTGERARARFSVSLPRDGLYFTEK